MKLLASIFACILLVVFAGCQNKAQTHTDKELVDSLNAIPPGPVVVLAVGTSATGSLQHDSRHFTGHRTAGLRRL